MPRRTKEKGLYQRGAYRLDWDKKSDGTLRSPFLQIYWYDAAARRERQASTGETELGRGRAKLDAYYIERTEGLSYCPTCGQLKSAKGGYSILDAINVYNTVVADKRSSSKEIRARLTHIIDYLATLPDPDVPCEAIDEDWIEGFRQWAIQRPIISRAGNARERSLSTVENSVLQLAAAINKAFELRNTTTRARFRAIPPKEVNRTPQMRLTVKQIASCFRYCVSPTSPSDKMRARHIRERAALHRFLMISVATLARPDAAHDVSIDPKRSQWNGPTSTLNLNPKGRRQTKKRRAIVPIAHQVTPHLEACLANYRQRLRKEEAGIKDGDTTSPFFVGVKDVGTAWDAMAKDLKFGLAGEGGMKLIRRSMANELRQRRVPADEIEVFMGHRVIDSTTELYAPFDPHYLIDARTAIEAIIEEVEGMVPGAFAMPESNVVSLEARRL